MRPVPRSIRLLCAALALLTLLAVGHRAARAQAMDTTFHRVDSGAPILPLDSVLIRVARDNPAVQQYTQLARAREASVAGARSWEAPKVSAGVWMRPYSPARARALSGDPDAPGGQAIFSVEQMIPNPAKQRARQAYLMSQVAGVQADGALRVVQLRAEARTLYYQQAVLTRKLAVLDENEELLRFLIRLAEARYPYNQSTLPGIYGAKARLEMHLNEHRQAAAMAEQNRIALNTLMNRPRTEPFTVDTLVLTIPLRVASADGDTAVLATQRSDVRSLDRSLTSMLLNQKLEASRRLPDFGVQFDHMPFLGTGATQFTLMGSISLPMVPWASREYRANVASLGHETRALRLQREEILNEALGRLAGLRTEIESRREQIMAYETRILPALQRSYQATLLAYEQNTGDLFPVLEAWSTLKLTRIEYLDTLEAQFTRQIAYEKELE